MSARLYLEGGGSASKELQSRCKEGFRKLLKKAGVEGRMPRLIACGPRENAFDDFKIAQAQKSAGDFVAMWIDSEMPLRNLEATWDHLARYHNWARPGGAADDQVLFMTTCMETLALADSGSACKALRAQLAGVGSSDVN